MTYACPTVLPNVPNMKCEIKFGQIQKVAFQRQGQSFTREEITTKAGWSAFLTSQTPSKIVVTPFSQERYVLTVQPNNSEISGCV